MEDEDDVYRDLARELGVSFAENKSNVVKMMIDMDNSENPSTSAAVLGNEFNAS